VCVCIYIYIFIYLFWFIHFEAYQEGFEDCTAYQAEDVRTQSKVV
jgi:hypothetical protein